MPPAPWSLAAVAATIAGGALLGACAGSARDCRALAGPGWSALNHAPVNAQALLAQENLPESSDVRWYRNANGDSLLACFYQPALVNPSCGGSTAYIFKHSGTGWNYQDQAMQQCAVEE